MTKVIFWHCLPLYNVTNYVIIMTTIIFRLCPPLHNVIHYNDYYDNDHFPDLSSTSKCNPLHDYYDNDNFLALSSTAQCNYFIFFKSQCYVVPYGKFGSVKQPQEQRYPFCFCLCSFWVSKQCYNKLYGCQCLGFLTRAQMLMHAIAHGGCTDTV